MSSTDEETLLDACGLACPLPLLKAKQALNRLQSGQRLRVLSTDAGSWRDFEVFCKQSGTRLLERESEEHRFVYVLEKV